MGKYLVINRLLIKADDLKPSSGTRKNSGDNLDSIVDTSMDNRDKNSTSEKSVMIICGPNAAPFEMFSYSDRWIEYYLEYGVSVFLWNYRGFGESQGSINFKNMKSDAASVYELLKNNYKFSKIGVHGISIGGIPACYLAEYLYIN